jgi:hypothetical protein
MKAWGTCGVEPYGLPTPMDGSTLAITHDVSDRIEYASACYIRKLRAQAIRKIKIDGL